jgi:hypothetical protein
MFTTHRQKSRGRRALGEALMSAAAVMLVLVALVSIDDRVREQIGMRVMRPTVELAREGKRVGDLSSVVMQAAREQSRTHAPLLIFSVAAGILTLFMLRT